MSRRKIEIKSHDQMRIMHKSGLVLEKALDTTIAAAKPGVTTQDLDDVFTQVLSDANATPNFLGYFGFPATICTSVNEEVVHGIPGPRMLEAGDVLKIDGGCIVDGWHSDSARTVVLGSAAQGSADPEDERLSEVTRKAMWRGIAALASAKYIGEIGDAIDDFVSNQPGDEFGILEDYVGHGIGTAMHQPPDVLNYRTGHKLEKIKPGMCLAIEPMLVRGSIETDVLEDDWTVITQDGSRASQWEHSVARHRDGIWVLTAKDGGASELKPLGVTPVPIPE